jgi:hypothetical protein
MKALNLTSVATARLALGSMLLVGAALVAAPAHANGRVNFAVGVNLPGVQTVVSNAPAQYVVPAGYYLGANGVLYPQPVYSQPVYEPVYVQPAPIYVRPAVGYVGYGGPVVYGNYPHGYYRGYRYGHNHGYNHGYGPVTYYRR